MTAIVIITAIILDIVLGEVQIFHPLVYFGKMAEWVEHKSRSRLNYHSKNATTVLFGLASLIVCILPFVVATMLLSISRQSKIIMDIAALYFAIGHRSLWEHAYPICSALRTQDIEGARRSLARIVSRDTGSLNPTEIARAATESVLENGNDAIFGAIFWYIIAGAPGVILFRLANTLDAMWGYRNERFEYFGKPTAILDDLMNWIPSRLTALSYSLVGNTLDGLNCWKNQGALWYSPNAGPVMASGAGALGVKLGGNAVYHGKKKNRPLLGINQEVEAKHILLSLQLVSKSLVLWVTVVTILEGLIFYVAPWRALN